MSELILDRDMESKLNSLHGPTTVMNQAGQPVGFFLPLDSYKRMLASLSIPFTVEELARRSKQSGSSLPSYGRSWGSTDDRSRRVGGCLRLQLGS